MNKLSIMLCAILLCLMGNIQAVAYIIDQSGRYVIGSDMMVLTDIDEDSGILIAASNVSVDGDMHQISQDPTGTGLNFNGIVVNPGLSGVLIENINVKNVSGNGVLINDGCTDINLIGVEVSNCDGAGILLDGDLISGYGIYFTTVSNCFASQCTGSLTSPAYGARIKGCVLSTIENSVFTGNDAGLTNTGFGMSVENCQTCGVLNSRFLGNGGADLGVGLIIADSTDILVQACSAIGNSAHSLSLSTTACGFMSVNSSRFGLIGCSSFKNVNMAGASFGYLLMTGTNSTVEESSAQVNFGGSYTSGIELVGETTSHVRDSISRSNQTIGAGPAFGIHLTSECLKSYVKNNFVANNVSLGGMSYGIADDSPASTNAIVTNEAFNHTTNYSVNYPVGISLPIHTASLSNTGVGIPTTSTSPLANLDVNP